MHFGIKIPQNICKYTVCMIIGNFHIVSYFVLFNLSKKYFRSHIFWEEDKKKAALKIPKSREVYIIPEWKRFLTTRTLPLADSLTIQSNWREKSCLETRPRTRWPLWQRPKGHVCRRASSMCEQISKRSSVTEAFHESGLYGRVARWKLRLNQSVLPTACT